MDTGHIPRLAATLTFYQLTRFFSSHASGVFKIPHKTTPHFLLPFHFKAGAKFYSRVPQRGHKYSLERTTNSSIAGRWLLHPAGLSSEQNLSPSCSPFFFLALIENSLLCSCYFRSIRKVSQLMGQTWVIPNIFFFTNSAQN